jgi:dolichyl-phosphate-mannose--protein O-mannosyl transferase
VWRVKASPENRRVWAYYALLVVAFLTLAVGWWARVWNLTFPRQRMWDEIYFPVFANKYLNGVPFFDLHPPLGKFILAASIAVFGNDPLGWRFMPAVFGCAMVVLAAVFAERYFGDRVAAILFATLVAGETIFIIYSRTGLLDGILVFFVLATFLVALRVENEDQVVWPALLLGLTIAIKWAVFGIAFPIGYIMWRRGLFRHFLASLYVSAVVYVLVVFAGQVWNPTGAGEFFSDKNTWVKVWNWHEQALANATRAVPNSEGSQWWTWPLLGRPIIFFHNTNAAGKDLVFLAIGNPFVWWSSTLAVVAGAGELVRRAVIRLSLADHPLVPIEMGYAVLMLPWIPGTRVPYLYNYLPIYAFALLALTYWLSRLWGYRRWGPWAVVLYAVVAFAFTLYFLPLVTGLPLDHEGLRQRIWLDSWDHGEFE